MKAVFFSDTHLGMGDGSKIAHVEQFLQDTCADADMIFVNGDLFEFYYGFKKNPFAFEWYRGILDALNQFAAQGKTVYMVEGNHEFNMASLSRTTGIKCADEFAVTLDGKTVFIAHGDKYATPRLRNFLKSPILLGIMELFHPVVTWKLAMVVRLFMSEKKKGRSTKAKHRFRLYADRLLKNGYHAVILAHTHIHDIVRKSSGRGEQIYCNTGDLIKDNVYIEYTSEKGFTLRHYTVSNITNADQSIVTSQDPD